ncbi:hypothetical protein H0H87_008977 [Tephrocybe sp. NHM501043]|nr:hypothetical protein H0H87_008977 [Tephrocybe sp. NHM501043]
MTFVAAPINNTTFEILPSSTLDNIRHQLSSASLNTRKSDPYIQWDGAQRADQFEHTIKHVRQKIEEIVDNNVNMDPIRSWVPKDATSDITAHCHNLKIPTTDMDLLTRGQGIDLFNELSGILCTIRDYVYLGNCVEAQLSLCKAALSNLDPGNGRIYAVIDEAQAAVDAFPVAFRNANYKSARPALRSFISSWLSFKLTIVITGTSLKRDSIIDALSSMMAKRNHINGGVTGTGSWVDSPRKVEKYLARYIPGSYLETESGKALVSRASYWLYGRPRFLSSYVQCVVDHGFKCYHRLLTKCISSITGGFVPLDGQDWEKIEPDARLQRNPLSPFDLDRAHEHLYNKPEFMQTIQEMTYHRLWTGDITNLAAKYTDETIAMVECGFARFPGATIEDGNPTMDEPLAYISADNWINKQGGSPSKHHAQLFKEIGKTSPEDKALERYTALCLANAFKNPNSLSNVFTFANAGVNRVLSRRSGRLVSCWTDAEGFHVVPCVIPLENTSTKLSPSHTLGYSPEESENVIEWLQCKKRAPFLFPGTEFGPSVVFRLQLDEPHCEIITVALKVEYRLTYDASSQEDLIKTAFRAVTPVRFWECRDEPKSDSESDFDSDSESDYESNFEMDEDLPARNLDSKMDEDLPAPNPDSKMDEDPSVQNLSPLNLQDQTTNALEALSNRFNSSKTNYYSVLRALYVYPAVNDDQTCTKLLDIAGELEDDPHEISIISNSDFKESSPIIKRANEKHERQVKTEAKKKQRRMPYPSNNRIPNTKSKITSKLVLQNLEDLSRRQLSFQLLLHRQLEALAWGGSTGPVPYLTRDPRDPELRSRVARLELRKAVDRYIAHEYPR